MSFSSWLRSLKFRLELPGRRRAGAKVKASRRPALELLENRITPDSGGATALSAQLEYLGGPLLANVHVIPIFLKDTSTHNTGAEVSPAVQSQLHDFFQTLTARAYIPRLLSEYSVANGPSGTFNIGTGSVGDSISDIQVASTNGTDTVPDPTDPTGSTTIHHTGNLLDDSAIQAAVKTVLADNPPTANSLYVVFTPPGDIVTDSSGDSLSQFLGFHSSFSDSHAAAGMKGKVPYAVIVDPGSTTVSGKPNIYLADSFQQLTQVSSHEMAEAITDALPHGSSDTTNTTGWVVTDNTNPASKAGGEVGDLVANENYTEDGHLIQYEWSNALQGPAHAIGVQAGSPTLYINQLTPPAVASFTSGVVATFTDPNFELNARDFVVQVWTYDGKQFHYYPATVGGGANGVYSVSISGASFAIGSLGSAFPADGMRVYVGEDPNHTGGFVPGNALSTRFTPFVVGSSAPLTYTADSGSGTHDFVLSRNGSDFELSDNNQVVFSQAIASTTRIDIKADPGVSTVPGANVADSLTIDYDPGSGPFGLVGFGVPVTFDGGPATAPPGVVGTIYHQFLPFIDGAAWNFSPDAYSVTSFNDGGTGIHLGEIHVDTTDGTVNVFTRAYAAGTATFTVSGRDPAGDIVSRDYSITFQDILVSPNSLPDGVVGQSGYNQALSGAGGTGNLTYSVSTGNLPNGLTLSADGVISGTPAIAGSYFFTVSATDSNGVTGSQPYSITVHFTLAPTKLGDSTVGLPYNVNFSSTGALGIVSYFVSAGYLPNGLFLLPNGQLVGTLARAGTFPFFITATDSEGGSARQFYLVTINPAGTSTTVTSSVNTPGYGQAVTFTARVEPQYSNTGTPTPSGTVTFKDGATTLGTRNLDANGQATFSTASLSVPLAIGPHNITAWYNGDVNFTASYGVFVGGTAVVTTVAGNGTGGFSGDGGPATAAQLFDSRGVTVDAYGNLFIADAGNHRIRKVSAATGQISTIAGTGTPGYSGDGGPATAARLNYPTGVIVDAAGDLFIADSDNHVVREINAATGKISTIAGNGTSGYSGDGGPATAAQLNSFWAQGIALDAAGNLFIADSNNFVVRKVSASGVITTVAGTGTFGYSGDGGPATAAELGVPEGLALDAAGNLFIADGNDEVIREVHTNGVITTVAGNGSEGNSGDGGAATAAKLGFPEGVAVAPPATCSSPTPATTSSAKSTSAPASSAPLRAMEPPAMALPVARPRRLRSALPTAWRWTRPVTSTSSRRASRSSARSANRFWFSPPRRRR
jgi:hypothetical protein